MVHRPHPNGRGAFPAGQASEGVAFLGCKRLELSILGMLDLSSYLNSGPKLLWQ